MLVDTPNGQVRCVTDGTLMNLGRGTPACDDQQAFGDQVVATPAPVSIALRGTGLFGIGGARLRRKKTSTA